MNADDFTIPKGEALFVTPLQPPKPSDHLALRNNLAFQRFVAQLKARHHDMNDPTTRHEMGVVMRLANDAATPPNPSTKVREKEHENEDEEADDLDPE